MIYEIVISEKAAKELRKIPNNYFNSIMQHIKALSINPRPNGYKKLTGYDSCYRIRIGSYRVIYSVENDILTITIIKVGHRQSVYE